MKRADPLLVQNRHFIRQQKFGKRLEQVFRHQPEPGNIRPPRDPQAAFLLLEGYVRGLPDRHN